MKIRSVFLTVPLLFLVGCSAPPPTVTKGTFTGSYSLLMQRGSADVVVKTTGTGSYVITNYRMDHPMGGRPDTEAEFTTSAGTFVVTDKGVPDGMLINGKPYPNRGRGSAAYRLTITIDEKGTVTASDPTPPDPSDEKSKDDKPKAKG